MKDKIEIALEKYSSWEEVPKTLLTAIIMYCPLTDDQVQTIWDGPLKKLSRYSSTKGKLLRNPSISTAFSEVHFFEYEFSYFQDYLLRHVTSSFIQFNWSSLGVREQHVALTTKVLELPFVLEHWSSLSNWTKAVSWRVQKLDERLTAKELPMLLTDNQATIRKRAQQLLQVNCPHLKERASCSDTIHLISEKACPRQDLL